MQLHHEDIVLTEARNVLQAKGRTFSFASHLLPSQMRKDATILYAFCRKVDDLADDPQQRSRAESALFDLRDQISTRNGRAPLTVAFLEMADRRGVSLISAERLIEGALSDVTGDSRIDNQEQLLNYCYLVAGTVGEMMCPIIGGRSELLAYASDLGIAMQLTNIARDVREDALLGRRYIPKRWIPNLSLNDLCRHSMETQEECKGAILRLRTLADNRYQSARVGLDQLPLASRIGISVAADVYREIGVRIQENDFDVRKGRTVVSHPRRMKVAFKTIARLLFATASQRLATVFRESIPGTY